MDDRTTLLTLFTLLLHYYYTLYYYYTTPPTTLHHLLHYTATLNTSHSTILTLTLTLTPPLTHTQLGGPGTGSAMHQHAPAWNLTISG